METLKDTFPISQLKVRPRSAFKTPDRTTLLGYLFLATSAALYGLEEYIGVKREVNNLSIFFIHYLIAIVYVIILIIDKSYGIIRSWKTQHLHKTVVLLHLFLISAYALNRQLPVFEASVPWLCYLLILVSLTMLSYRYFDSLPRYVNRLQHFILGTAFLLYLYMTIYVANFYIVGTIGILLFGIGTHVFVPGLLLYVSIRLMAHQKDMGRGWAIAGGAATIIFVTSFVVEWNKRTHAIDRMANQSVIYSDTELPVWVKVARTIQNDWLTERILKSKLVYTVANNDFQWSFMPRTSWDEQRKHDPLVFIATATTHSPLSVEDSKNVLMAITDNRDRAQERLWSGDNLTTSYIVTDVDIYSNLRIAYSEHYLNIRNDAGERRWWGNTEEAIYTFQLPEGSVVTALSLWVNGKEEKAILTSKQKATQAYNTIVGKEMRDPSVVQWQEGNTISVRVFPCTPEEERKFKIGITSPLQIVDGKSIYGNVTFRGPNPGRSAQTTRIRVIGTPANMNVPNSFERNSVGEYIREGTYDPDLAIAMDVTPIAPNQFSFDGFTYSLANSKPQLISTDLATVYLDINNSWTSKEVESLRRLLDTHKLFAYSENDFIALTRNNWRDITDDLLQNNFSLFPFHRVNAVQTSLVVTKGRELSPHLQDFKTSFFAAGIREYFASGNKVFLFNLYGGTSTYVRSLKEFRAFNYAHGSVENLLQLLHTQEFPIVPESDEQIYLPEASMVLEKKVATDSDKPDNAPDHLARLFAYNNIMRQVGANFFDSDFVNEQLVDEAARAYVVSPVSSLIVLETQKDYDRFGIKDIENSLQNASKNSLGAVPEPHEWALIVLFGLLITFYALKRFMA